MNIFRKHDLPLGKNHGISAAPELLKACESMLSWLVNYADPNTGGYEAEKRLLENAIAKAKVTMPKYALSEEGVKND